VINFGFYYGEYYIYYDEYYGDWWACDYYSCYDISYYM